MDRHEFEVFYSGSSIEESTMDVKDLAPSLLALGELFQEANRLLNKGERTLRVSVKAFKPGSFGVTLNLDSSLIAQISALVRDANLYDARAICALLFGGGLGLIALLKKLKGKKPDRAVKTKEGTVDLHVTGDNNNVQIYNVSEPVYGLFVSMPVRKGVEAFVKPLKGRGVEDIVTKMKGAEESVNEEEVEALAAPPLEEQLLTQNDSELVLSILTLSFQGDSWRFSDGQSRFWAEMRDTAFLSQVEQNQAAFRKGDRLKAKLRTTQRQMTDGELKNDYCVLEVLEHIPGAYQMPLLLERDLEPVKS